MRKTYWKGERESLKKLVEQNPTIPRIVLENFKGLLGDESPEALIDELVYGILLNGEPLTFDEIETYRVALQDFDGDVADRAVNALEEAIVLALQVDHSWTPGMALMKIQGAQ